MYYTIFQPWFTIPKKNRMLRFIQDMQWVNKVTKKSMGLSQFVNEFVEEFARRAIYSMDNFYLEYD